MLDRNYILQNLEAVKQNIENRNMKVDLDAFVALDAQRRKLVGEVEELRAQRNENSNKIKSASNEERPAIIEAGKALKEQIGSLEEQLNQVEQDFKTIWLQIPNMASPESPIGDDDHGNTEAGQFGTQPDFSFTPKNHLEIAEEKDLVDFEHAAKVTGSKFYYLKNDLVLLEFAIVQYLLRLLTTKYGFTALTTPDLARQDILVGTGFNPRDESSQIYNIENTDLSLIGTSEITVAGMHAGETLDLADLPIKYVAVSHCYRNEAGSYGKYEKGLYRVHQFTKVEMFIYAHPSKSVEMHELLKDIEIEIYESLNIPFRLVDICTGDLGSPAYKKYDLEAWMPGKANPDGSLGDWGEITSTSNCTDYQARRLNIKFKGEEGSEFVHTLNGTASAITRTILAIMENNQNEDGTFNVPEVLQEFVGKKIIG
jgi:seryl-tRNA synthetase